MKIWAYPPPYQSGVGLSGTLSTPLSLRYVQTTPTIPYARDEQSRGRKTNNHGICQRTIYFLRINIIIYKTTLHMAIEIACTVLSVRGFNGVYFIQMEVIKFIIFK